MAAVEFTATRLLAPQLHFLRDRGFDVRLACRPERSTFDPALAVFEPRSVGFPRSLSPLDMARGARELRKVVRELAPDAVHFHSPAAAMPGRLGLGLGFKRPRIVYTVHGFLHQWDAMGRRDRVVERLEYLLSFRTDLLLFQSSEDYAAASDRRYHGRLRYLGNGVPAVWFTAPRPDLGTGARRHVVYVGRLSREKGVMDLLHAVHRVPGVELTLVGGALPSDRDDVSAEARSFVGEHGMDDRVSFAGMVSPDEVRELLRTADAFVLPSWREGVPRSVVEAMAAGLPVVATDIRGCRELIRSEQEGWLVPPRDAASLAAALAEVATSRADVLQAMGRSAYERSRSQFHESSVFERLLAAYAELGLSGA